jgi:mannose-1-phosphate guanylyltransferase
MAVPAMVLCAGLGTRLRPLTDELPKPLVPVGDRSVLEHVLGNLRRAGVERFVLNTHHGVEAFERLELPGVARTHEPAILGTAGGVANAAAALGPGDVLVHNGDILAEVDVAALLAARRPDALAVLAVNGGLPAGAGTVGIDGDGRVARLRGRRFGDEVAGGDFAGVQVLAERARLLLPAVGCLVGDVYLPALERGDSVLAAPVVAWFRDIGTIAEYLDANLAWLGARAAWAAEATVAAEIALDRAVVGAGAVVGGSGAVRESVVWPGARATAPLDRSVVTTSGRVVFQPPLAPP